MPQALVRLREGDGSKPPTKRTPLPICQHRGKQIDLTTCRCAVFACKVHGTCSNSRRAGLTVCPCESYLAPFLSQDG